MYPSLWSFEGAVPNRLDHLPTHLQGLASVLLPVRADRRKNLKRLRKLFPSFICTTTPARVRTEKNLNSGKHPVIKNADELLFIQTKQEKSG